jgi:hypothetical protein
MIKVQNQIATRTPVPKFLQGLKPGSLQDLSWTDPTLGAQGCAWYPEEDQSPQLGQYERYEGEILTIDTERKIVVVTKNIVPFTPEEIEQAEHEEWLNRVPQTVSRFQARAALHLAGLLETIEGAIAISTDDMVKLAWNEAQEFKRLSPTVLAISAGLGLTDEQLDDLFITAATIEA